MTGEPCNIWYTTRDKATEPEDTLIAVPTATTHSARTRVPTYYDLYYCKTTKVIKQVADLRVKYLATTVAIQEKAWIKIPTAPKWGNVIFL